MSLTRLGFHPSVWLTRRRAALIVALLCLKLLHAHYTDPPFITVLVFGAPSSLVEEEKARLAKPVMEFRRANGRYPASLQEAGVTPSPWAERWVTYSSGELNIKSGGAWGAYWTYECDCDHWAYFPFG